jgi:hypothetical protein
MKVIRGRMCISSNTTDRGRMWATASERGFPLLERGAAKKNPARLGRFRNGGLMPWLRGGELLSSSLRVSS